MDDSIQEEFEEDTQKNKFLTFSLGKELYALEIQYVMEIIGLQTITEVPEVPEYIKGIINLRGKIIPVIDVRSRFKKSSVAYSDRTCIVVVNVANTVVGLIVDAVAEVLIIEEENIVAPPEMSSGQHQFIQGVGKIESQVALILDCGKVLHEEGLENITYKA